MRTALIAISALALGMTATSVSARDFVVQHDDLDLSDKHDQDTLKSRINVAAREFCGVTRIRTGTRLRNPRETACVNEVTKLAKAQMAELIAGQPNKGG